MEALCASGHMQMVGVHADVLTQTVTLCPGTHTGMVDDHQFPSLHERLGPCPVIELRDWMRHVEAHHPWIWCIQEEHTLCIGCSHGWVSARNEIVFPHRRAHRRIIRSTPPHCVPFTFHSFHSFSLTVFRMQRSR